MELQEGPSRAPDLPGTQGCREPAIPWITAPPPHPWSQHSPAKAPHPRGKGADTAHPDGSRWQALFAPPSCLKFFLNTRRLTQCGWNPGPAGVGPHKPSDPGMSFPGPREQGRRCLLTPGSLDPQIPVPAPTANKRPSHGLLNAPMCAFLCFWGDFSAQHGSEHTAEVLAAVPSAGVR